MHVSSAVCAVADDSRYIPVECKPLDMLDVVKLDARLTVFLGDYPLAIKQLPGKARRLQQPLGNSHYLIERTMRQSSDLN